MRHEVCMSKPITQPLEETTTAAQRARRQWSYDAISTGTGVFLALFMWAHMAFVSTIWTGQVGFDWIAEIFEITWLAQIGIVVVATAFFVHFVMASRKIPGKLQERKRIKELGDSIRDSAWQFDPESQKALVKIRPHKETSLWIWQVRTGMVILALGSMHLFVISSDLLERSLGVLGIGPGMGIHAAESMARVQSGMWVLYAILLLAVEVHAGVGLYRVAVKWWLGVRILGVEITRERAHLAERVVLWFFVVVGLVSLLILAGVLPPPLAFLLT
jgi:fumarate reductase subunit C